MATLEKIRSKSVLLFTIIIVALLAFIMGDFLTSGRSFFGPGSAIAKVAGHKIDINEYQNRLTANSERAMAQGQQRPDNDELAQQTIQELAFEAMINDQIEKLGINVTDSEISRAMTGETPHPAVQQFIMGVAQQLQLPEASGRVILDVMNNPARYNFPAEIGPELKNMWAAQEQQLEKTLKQNAFGRLVGGLFVANDLDAQSVYDDNMTTARVSYVSAPFSSVSDDDAQISEADIKAQWEKNKAQYRLDDETRTVDYVVVNIVPSFEDFANAEVEVDKAVNDLRNTAGLDGIAGKAKFANETVTIPVSRIKSNADLRMLPDSALVKDNVYKFPRRQNTFTIAKVLDVTSQIDSINISMAAFPTRQAADSVMALITAGKTMSEVVAENQGNALGDQWNTLIGAPAQMKQMFADAAVGQPFVYSDSVQGQGAIIYNVNQRRSPVQVAEVSVIKYVVDPSNETVTNLKTQLNSFVASNSKGDAFSANADSLYNLMHAEVTPSSPHIGAVPESRRAVKWVMEAKKGEVSPVFDTQDYYMVVAVKDIYDGEYRPYNAPELQDYLSAQARADKKAAKLIEQYKGQASDLAGYAQKMNSSVMTDSTVVFTSPRLATLGYNNYALQGQIAAAKPGQLTGPVQGTSEVVVFVVDGVSKEGRPFDAIQDRATFMQTFGINNPFVMLLGDEKIQNNSLHFVAGDR